MKTIGTIVTLKKSHQKVMIITRNVLAIIEGKEMLFDYGSCFYPQGVNPKEMYYFNEENIEKIIFEGYRDDANQKLEIESKKFLKENINKYEKGIVN